MNTAFDEIVGFMVNGYILSGRTALITVKALNDYQFPIYRCVAALMATLDLGSNWTKLANAETLIFLRPDKTIDEERTWKQFEKFGFGRKKIDV